MADAQFIEVLDAGAGWTKVRDASGNVYTLEGARNWRNNNPGNIEYGEFAKAHGAIGSDGRFAVFPSYDAGREAKQSLLFDSPAYRNLTLRQAISRYAPPSENNTNAYIRQVADAAGVSPNTVVSQIPAAKRTAMLDAMERVEGYSVGRTRDATGNPVPPVNIPVVATALDTKQGAPVPASQSAYMAESRDRQPLAKPAPLIFAEKKPLNPTLVSALARLGVEREARGTISLGKKAAAPINVASIEARDEAAKPGNIKTAGGIAGTVQMRPGARPASVPAPTVQNVLRPTGTAMGSTGNALSASGSVALSAPGAKAPTPEQIESVKLAQLRLDAFDKAEQDRIAAEKRRAALAAAEKVIAAKAAPAAKPKISEVGGGGAYLTTQFQQDRFQTTPGALMPSSLSNSRWTTGYK